MGRVEGAGYLSPSLRPNFTVPRPISETRIPVLPSSRYCTSSIPGGARDAGSRQAAAMSGAWLRRLESSAASTLSPRSGASASFVGQQTSTFADRRDIGFVGTAARRAAPAPRDRCAAIRIARPPGRSTADTRRVRFARARLLARRCGRRRRSRLPADVPDAPRAGIDVRRDGQARLGADELVDAVRVQRRQIRRADDQLMQRAPLHRVRVRALSSVSLPAPAANTYRSAATSQSGRRIASSEPSWRRTSVRGLTLAR